VLHHRTGNHVAEALSGEAEALDGTAKGCGEHVLVADFRVRAVGTGKRDAGPAQYGDAPDCRADQHEFLSCVRSLVR
jgi:hypothetical protein